MAEVPDNCPACGSSWIGDEIPEAIREHYSPPYRWRRQVGLTWNDRVQEYQCPDCEARFSRWTMERVSAPLPRHEDKKEGEG